MCFEGDERREGNNEVYGDYLKGLCSYLIAFTERHYTLYCGECKEIKEICCGTAHKKSRSLDAATWKDPGYTAPLNAL